MVRCHEHHSRASTVSSVRISYTRMAMQENEIHHWRFGTLASFSTFPDAVRCTRSLPPCLPSFLETFRTNLTTVFSLLKVVQAALRWR